MAILRLPNRIEPLRIPAFGMSWYADISTGHQWLAYCGGGGSAKSGIFNQIIVVFNNDNENKQCISTGEAIASSILLYPTPFDGIHLMATLGKTVVRYALRGADTVPQACGTIELEDTADMVNTMAVNASHEQVALGCETGLVFLYTMNNNDDDNNNNTTSSFATPQFKLTGHTKAVCSVQFSQRNNRLISSAKDGTTRVWDTTNGGCIQTLNCQIDTWNAPPPAGRPKQILVKGCAFCDDLDGNTIVTCASGRRGDAYLTMWVNNGSAQSDQQQQYTMARHTKVSATPVSAMGMSRDDVLLALGSVEGTITLFHIPTWKTLKIYKEVHELPVTCITARPFYPTLLWEGEFDTNVPVHAISGSADSKLAFMTLLKRMPPKYRPSRSPKSWTSWLYDIVWHGIIVSILLWILYPMGLEAWEKCGDPVSVVTPDQEEWERWMDIAVWKVTLQCIQEQVLWAPAHQMPPWTQR